MRKKYVLLEWPESQIISNLPENIQEECIPGEDASYFIPEEYEHLIVM